MTTTLEAPHHLSLERVSHSFDALPVLDDVTLHIAPRSFTALLGPSGCGKTTMLRLLGGLDEPSVGTCTRPPHRASVCFQEPRLLPWRTIVSNVALPLELQGVPKRDRLARAMNALALTQLSDAATRYPSELSGGMKMRASLARALVSQPETLLLDEPCSALDEITRHEISGELRTLWERERFTAVLVTHSIAEAVFLADRVIVCSPRPARIVAEITTPTLPRDAHFWTSDALVACARQASDALLEAIAQARQ